MTPKPLLARFVLVASAVCAPLCAHTPLFTDGPAFGGSEVFSEGMNPLANSARYGQAPTGYYFTYLDGDQRSKDINSILDNTMSANPAAASAALAQLANSPWALRTRAYGFTALKKGGALGLTREELNGILATPDLAAFNLGSGLAGNQSTLAARRAVVDRLNLGGGGPLEKGSTTALGVSLRVERWEMGQTTVPFNPPPAFGGADTNLLGGTGTSAQSWNLALDAGIVLEMAQGVRLGLSADQLNAKHLWDVYLQPQFRAGIQLDLGQQTKLSIEGDINSVERMPLPVKQQSASASLRFALSQAAAFLVGAEQRKLAGVSQTFIGGTLQIRTDSILLSVGFNAGQDRPMKGATFMVN
jgi:hypothetical protein